MTRYYITYCYTDKKRNVKKAHTFYDTESILTETDLNELIKSITERNEYKKSKRKGKKGMEIKTILEEHKKWLETEGTEGKRADLCHTNLCGANLCGANLCGADLFDANLRNANLRHTNLCGANLCGANLCGAFLAKKEQYRLGTILSKKIIGYKKCRDDVIVKLEIPKGAIVFCINGSKCRTNKAKVLEIIGADKAVSEYDETFVYEMGKNYEIKNFNLMYNVECGTGIHFFKTEKEAKEWSN